MKMLGKSRRGGSTSVDLTQGVIWKQIMTFSIPLFMGQLLQQFYNVVDAWVVGNFADNDSFAAVSSAGNMTFLVVGFFRINQFISLISVYTPGWGASCFGWITLLQKTPAVVWVRMVSSHSPWYRTPP